MNLLRVRAGTPPSAAVLLIRYHTIDAAFTRLGDLWRAWEAWFTDVEETHTTFPVLPFFRSPTPQQSWVSAAGALLDSAALWLAAVDHDPDPDAALCVRTGFQALRRIADMFAIAFDEDPSPGDAISVSRAEWDVAVDQLAAAGLAVRAERDEAWAAWRGWRVNYDTVLLSLARIIEAPPAPWVSDRSPIALSDPQRRRSIGLSARRTDRRIRGSWITRRPPTGRSGEPPAPSPPPVTGRGASSSRR